jgi:hypothetical protein
LERIDAEQRRRGDEEEEEEHKSEPKSHEITSYRISI